jgi:hypothetical protein
MANRSSAPITCFDTSRIHGRGECQRAQLTRVNRRRRAARRAEGSASSCRRGGAPAWRRRAGPVRVRSPRRQSKRGRRRPDPGQGSAALSAQPAERPTNPPRSRASYCRRGRSRAPSRRARRDAPARRSAREWHRPGRERLRSVIYLQGTGAAPHACRKQKNPPPRNILSAENGAYLPEFRGALIMSDKLIGHPSSQIGAAVSTPIAFRTRA